MCFSHRDTEFLPGALKHFESSEEEAQLICFSHLKNKNEMDRWQVQEFADER